MKCIVDYVKEIKKKHNSNNPFDICKLLDIEVIYIDLPKKVKGFYVKFFDSQFIYINCDIEDQEKKYICAHELGHALFHEEVNSIFIRDKTLVNSAKLENEADLFAACLLLNDDMFDYEKTGFTTIDQIALFSGVEKRLVQMKIDRAM